MIEAFVRSADTNIYHVRVRPNDDVPAYSSYTNLGKPPNLTPVGRPAAVALNSFTMVVFTRANDNSLWYRFWSKDKQWTDTTWQLVPNVNNVASNLEVVSRDDNHVTVFYKSANNQVYMAEMAYGKWFTNSISPVTGFVSELSAVSRNPNHMAVFGVDANGSLWSREWTADKKPDWSDAEPWNFSPSQITGKSFYAGYSKKPPVMANGGQIQVVVDPLGNVSTANPLFQLTQTYDSNGNPTGWTSTQLPIGSLAQTNITGIHANTFLVAGVGWNGSAYATTPPTNSVTGLGASGSLNTNKPSMLVAWEPGQAVLLALNNNKQLIAISYTSYEQNPAKTSFSANIPFNHNQYNNYGEPKTNDAELFKFQGHSYLAWTEYSNGQNTLNVASDPYYNNRKSVSFTARSNTYPRLLTYADVTNTGQPWLVLVRAENETQITVDLYQPDTLEKKATYTFSPSNGSAFPSAVAAGDLDGKGQDEIAIANTWGNQISITILQYDTTTGTLSVAANHGKTIPVQSSERFYSVDLVIGRFSSGQPKEQLVVGYTTTYNYNLLIAYQWQDNGNLIELGRYVNKFGKGFTAVTVADLDGDGIDEIAQYLSKPGAISLLITYDLTNSDPNNKMKVLGTINNSDISAYLRAGDLDEDGKSELVIYNDRLRVFKQAPELDKGNLLQMYVADTWDVNGAWDHPFVVGDVDNDGITVVADGCEDKQEQRIMAVLYSPPRWGGHDGQQQTSFSYGKSYTSGNASENTTSNTVGGSVSFGYKFEQAIPVIGTKIAEASLSVTQDFAYTWSQANSLETAYTASYSVNGNNSDAQVVVGISNYRCNYFRAASEPIGTRSIQSCYSTSNPSFNSYTLEDWYDPSKAPYNQRYWVDLKQQNGAEGFPHSSSIENYYSKISPVIPAEHAPIVYDLQACSTCNITTSSNQISFSLEQTVDHSQTKTQSWETNTTISAGGEVGQATFEAGFTFGFSGDKSYTVSWGEGWNFQVNLDNLPDNSNAGYSFSPYLYQATASTQGGANYPYMVLDYVYDSSSNKSTHSNNLLVSSLLQTPPQIPVLTSPSHPDPLTWVPTSTVTLEWEQPSGDSVVIAGYDWAITPMEAFTLTGVTDVLSTTTTYTNLTDGEWFMHLVARSATGEFSEVASHGVRVDTQPPQVNIAAPAPKTSDGWHNSPFMVTLTADDAAGSGVAGIEYQLDNGGWQAYTTPLLFNTNMPTTTLWVRATDQIGQVSPPLSTTIKLDLTPPSSLDADGYRISYASVITSPAGNTWIKLGGQLDDGLSGRSDMRISEESGAFYPVDELGLFPMPPGNQISTTETTLNWIFTHTLSVHGSYPIYGYGYDRAGNREATSELGIFTWLPNGQPDFAQTLVSVQPESAYPGEVVTFTVAVRNSGAIEANALITETLPAGLSVLPETISDDGQYLAGSNAIVWTIQPAWPGQVRYLTFSAIVDLSPANPTTLPHSLTLKPYWPDISGTIAQPAASQVNGEITILPTPTDESSSQTPILYRAEVHQGHLVADRDVWLYLEASLDAQAVLVREFTLNPASAEWELAQESNWMPFENGDNFFNVHTWESEHVGMLEWTLSPGDGVKYLVVYLGGDNGQVSHPNASALVYTNLISPYGGTLNTDEHVQFRLTLKQNELAIWNLVVFSGEADLYAWRPRFAQNPEYLSLGSLPGPGFTIVVSAFSVDETGDYILEVAALDGPLSYRLSPAGDVAVPNLTLSDMEGNFDHSALAAFDQLGNTPYELLMTGEGVSHQIQSPNIPPDNPFTLTVPLDGALQPLPPFTPFPTIHKYFMPLIAVKP